MTDQSNDPDPYGTPLWHSAAKLVFAKRALGLDKPCRTCEDSMDTPDGECPRDSPCALGCGKKKRLVLSLKT
jgi:hypothetical protein